MTDKLLSQAFELQRFAPNSRLQAVIDSTHARLAALELSDEELDYVAAGTRMPPTKPEETRS